MVYFNTGAESDVYECYFIIVICYCYYFVILLLSDHPSMELIVITVNISPQFNIKPHLKAHDLQKKSNLCAVYISLFRWTTL